MPSVLSGTPREDGYRMPAEWEPHDGCYLVWPQRPDTWRNGGKPAQGAGGRAAGAVSGERAGGVGGSEPVTVVASGGQWRNARARLPSAVRVVEASTNDAWVRDTGP